jgi:hypothetical protein
MWISVDYLLTNPPLKEKFQTDPKCVENVLVVHNSFTYIVHHLYHWEQ